MNKKDLNEQEIRTRFIAEAVTVTGKLYVRQAGAHLPQEADEENAEGMGGAGAEVRDGE